MVSTLQRFHCGFLKDALSSTKDTSINFFSLNFTSIETKGERVSSSQSESTLWGGGTRKRTRANNGESGDWEGGEVRVKTRESSANTLFECPHTGIAQYHKVKVTRQ